MNTYFWDIETSRITTDQGEEMQITYLSNVLTMDTDTGEITNSIFHRTMSEVVEYFQSLSKKSIVWVHNLDYELTFLLRETQWSLSSKETSIFRDKNAPLQIYFEQLPNVCFRDSYALFNTSVEKLGDALIERITGRKIEELQEENKYKFYSRLFGKLDYDYKIVRLPWDDLTYHDYRYNKRDNEVVARSIYNYMTDHGYTVEQIPLTFTSQVRRARKNFIINNYGKKALNKFYFDRNKFYTTCNLFEFFTKVYQGGLTASIVNQTGKMIESKNTSGVIGIDIKSSYPNQMCTKKYPRFEEDNTTWGDLANRIWNAKLYKHFVGIFEFTNIRIKNQGYILPISGIQMSKGSVENAKTFNGKLLSADFLSLPATNIDLDTINLVYEYDDIKCVRITTTKKDVYLRTEEVSFLLTNFLNKEKGINKASSKLIINSMYGVKVANPIKDEFDIKDGEITVDKFFDHNPEEKEEKFNNFVETQPMFGGGLDVYSDGVYITGYARYQLVSMMKYIVDNGGHVVYSDTDSIKFYCKNRKQLEKLSKSVLKFNKEKKESNKKLLRFKQFKEHFNISDEDMDIISTLGIWEIEDVDAEGNIAPHQVFKTLGAKKYGYINFEGKVKTTIAGCNKKNIPIVIENVSTENNVDLFEAFRIVFSCGTCFDESASGRTTATKENRPHEMFHGQTYNGKLINQFGGIVIKDTTYTLNMKLDDTKIIGGIPVETITMRVNIKGECDFE